MAEAEPEHRAGTGRAARPEQGAEPRQAVTARRARAVLRAADRLLTSARAVLADHASILDDARRALTPLRDDLVRRELDGIPVARLKDVTEGRVRLGTLERCGYTTVGQVYAATLYDLQLVPGIGAQTARQALAAARTIAEAAGETVAIRIDVDHQDPRTTALVVELNRLVAAGPDIPRARETAALLDRELTALLALARPARGRLRMLFTRRERRERARRAVERIETLTADAAERDVPLLLAQASADLLRQPLPPVEAWIDFEIRPAEYYGLLAEIAGFTSDDPASEGFLPTGLADRVRAQALDDTHRRVSLRGYQAFGARFALAQRRVIIGDEMGLGKTIQAVAALAHLKARGQTHFLVACPASVLLNWTREIEARSTLRAWRVHGSDRRAGLAEWLRHGDVAVTTLDSLHTLAPPRGLALGMLVVDEAHYVKNPDARRSRAVAAWSGRTGRVLFLTGTPMENRVEEFRSLVRYLQPDLVPGIQGSDAVAGSQAFRKSVGPAYLRRNQEDVLAELPELVHVDEWEEFSAADLAAYREAVADRNFMAMRRAAYADPSASAKLQRLRELVGEAADNGRKVVVFSYFRDVLATVHQALGPGVFGPLAGDTPAVRRQELVDDFGAAPGHAVLLSQIQAGGVGLNMQAASVVILCEPQVKPTTESQAVGRAHRMGQARSVQVHRLLATDSVDQRMLEILGAKRRLFDAYARRSDLAESAPEAVDVSEQSLARQIVEEEQLRLAGARPPTVPAAD